ncbi:MAG: M6 family metalloprotease domain-containing protein [candidate division WOR-3 bacterium]|nr:M6 family metalloprotease domain-containing protein [candidate division WOR-3 bacterium]
MRTIASILVLSAVALAMPPRPGVREGTNSPLPVYPSGVEVAGPNLLRGYSDLETVTILMQFPDNRADTVERSPARFDSMLYSTGVYNGLPYRAGSLNDYWLECSYGDYHVRGGIGGGRWFMSTHNYADYYDGQYLLGTGGQLAEENMEQVDAYVDFSQFDLNHDGHIPACFMVHAGADGSDNGDVNCLWSHAIPWFDYQTNDGVIIDGVTNVPEFAMVTEARETTMCCIAVMCHEMGHLVGLPDLYDGGRYDWGPGYWSLMSYGAWGAGGNMPWSPSHPDAWCLNEAGFVTPSVVTTNLYNVHIPPIEDEPVVYKAWRNGTNRDTCFYLENRQHRGFDKPLPGAGLAIWHIDPAQHSMWNYVDLEEDSTSHLDSGFGYRPDPHVYHPEMGDTSDVLPGNWNRVAFDSTTKPSSKDRLNHSTGVCVRNIRQSGDTIICDIIVKPESVGVAEGLTLDARRQTLQAAPNPFSREVNLTVMPAGAAEVRIYSTAGALVWRARVPASGKLTWDGAGSSGTRLPEGVYLVQVSGAAAAPLKVVLNR